MTRNVAGYVCEILALALALIAYTPRLAAADAPATAAALAGPWVIRIENPRHEIITTITLRFTDEAAQSCRGGAWKRIVVTSHATSDPRFFPATEPLSYELQGDRITIGRNEICDAYLELTGVLQGSSARGRYTSNAKGGGRQLGYFSMHPDT